MKKPLNKAKVIDEFEKLYRKLYIEKVDYWTAQLAWAEFIDGLNKEGKITDRQASIWTTPFPYGKHLKPNKKQLEYEVYEV